MDKIFTICLAVFVIGGAIFYLVRLTILGEYPTGVVKSFYHQSAADGINQVMNLTTVAGGIAAEQGPGKVELQKWVELINDRQIQITRIMNECVNGDEAWVVVDTTDKYSKTRKIACKLRQTEGAWKIYGLASFILFEPAFQCSND